MKIESIFTKIKNKLTEFNELGICLVLVVLCIIIGFVNSNFWSMDNVMNIIRSSSYLAILSVGQCMVLLLGDFDLSAGNLMGTAGIVCAVGMNVLGLPIWVSILMGLAVAAVFGFVNGTLIVKARIPAFIVTLGTMYIAKGVTNVITEGRSVFPLAEGFDFLGNYELFGFIPFSVVIMIVLLVAADFVVRKTVLGRQIMAIGGNPEAAKLSGINSGKIKQGVFVFMGLCSGLTGIIITSRMATGQANTGTGYELQSVAACLIGGTSTAGGKGSMLGALIGCLLMNVITNGMVLMRINTYWQNIVLGIIIIGAVALDLYNRRKTGDVV